MWTRGADDRPPAAASRSSRRRRPRRRRPRRSPSRAPAVRARPSHDDVATTRPAVAVLASGTSTDDASRPSRSRRRRRRRRPPGRRCAGSRRRGCRRARRAPVRPRPRARSRAHADGRDDETGRHRTAVREVHEVRLARLPGVDADDRRPREPHPGGPHRLVTGSTISGSSGAMTWSVASTRVTATPRRTRLGHLDPDEAAPDDDRSWASWAEATRWSRSSTSRSVWATEMPGMRGTTGRAPGERTSASYSSSTSSSVERSRTVTRRSRGRSPAPRAAPARRWRSEPPATRASGAGGGALLDDAAEVVGQSAVRERHVAAALDDGDGRLLVEPPQPGGGGHATGHSPDDHDLPHGSIVYPRGSGR